MLRKLCKILTCLATLALVSPNANSEMIYEYFNDYGTNRRSVLGLGGGSGWDGPWTGYHNGVYYGNSAYHTYDAPGYLPTSNETGPEDGAAYRITGHPNAREFGKSLTDTVWFSAVGWIGSNRYYRSIDFGHGWLLTPFFGMNVDKHAYVRLNGEEVKSSRVYHDGAHLFLLKMQLNYNDTGHDRISLWVDPDSLTGSEADLGTPLMLDGSNIFGSWNNITLSLGGGSEIDAIRLSHGNISSTTKRQEVLTGIPVGESVSITSGLDQCGDVLGGASSTGGISVCFDQTGGGTFHADHEAMTQTEFLNRLLDGEFPFDSANFFLPSNQFMLWDLSYNGSITGTATVTLGYDPSITVPAERLLIYHLVAGAWQPIIPTSIDAIAHTITFQTDSFSPFVLGDSVPEPSCLWFLLAAGPYLTHRRR